MGTDSEFGLEPGTVVDGRYTIERGIGRGGFGEVYVARHEMLGRTLALKLLHPFLAENAEHHTRFQREARATAMLNHKNICAARDLGHSEYGPYMTMDLLEGASLRETLEWDGKPLSWESVVRLGVGIGHALTAVHEAGIYHRDLKPGNVFIKGELPVRVDQVVVLDFGLATEMPGEGKQLTQWNAMMGTPAYMAPEQLKTRVTANAMTDVYGIGATLYAALTGADPYSGSALQIVYKVISAEKLEVDIATARPDAPPGLGMIIEQAMHHDLSKRFQTSAALVAALRGLLPDSSYTDAELSELDESATVKFDPQSRQVSQIRDFIEGQGEEPPAPRLSVIPLPIHTVGEPDESD